jgi:hypothetical protein
MEKEGFFADPKMKLLIFTEQPFTTRNGEGASFFSDVRRWRAFAGQDRVVPAQGQDA